ncbi:MAG: ABC transporter ATP-binding protein [Deltaproteobacteria bacterium]|nr:ABC transporter ATP-binding protein [Deltaproteobacteria bacterium]
MALVQFRNVTKAFGPKVVFSGLNLDIHQGESLTIIGGSGSGKSVMLKLLIGLLKCDSGTITFDGEDVTDKSENDLVKIRQRIGMLFQGAALFDSLNVRENLAYGLREHYKLSEAEISIRVNESLQYVGLPGIEAMSPSDLSGGMKKRVGLARAITVRPEVLLYDEPTTGLDPINTTRINRLILHLKKKLKVTSVVVTHDLQSAFMISDRIAMIAGGRVVFDGTPEEIQKSVDPLVRDFVRGEAPQYEDTETLLRSAG